jgi:small subunit ribosomal protein S8
MQGRGLQLTVNNKEKKMSLIDPIADALTSLRNAKTAGKEKVDVRASKIILEICRILKAEGFIRNYKWLDDNKQGLIRIYLRFVGEKKSVLHGLRRVSKPGLRLYVKRDKVPRVYQGTGIAILSTSQGLLSDQQAREKGLGGEVICYVW